MVVVEFRVLGPVRIWSAGREWTHGWATLRHLLAVLVLDIDSVVPVGRLVEAVWDQPPAKNPRNSVQALVARLRRMLAEAGAANCGAAIETHEDGYRLRPGSSVVDLVRVRALASSSAAAASRGSIDEAARLARRARQLWQGMPLADLSSDWARQERNGLEQQRSQYLAQWFGLELRLGSATEILDELAVAVQRHPGSEDLTARRMEALYLCGREVEALRCFQNHRRHIRTFLDDPTVEPSRWLQNMYRGVQRRDLTVSDWARPAPGRLPLDVVDFVGRRSQITQAVEMLTNRSPREAIVNIYGRAGVGKTALAVHLGHKLREAFPDGRHYVHLRAMGARPISTRTAVSRILQQMGADPADIPVTLDAQIERYHAAFEGRRALLILDAAASEAQVRPLLPADTDCLVLITSQPPLAGLDTATDLELREFDLDEACQLLGAIAGADRVRAEPEGATEIVEQCDRLPLAISIAGARLANKPHWSPQELADRLANEPNRLGELQVGDRAVRPSLSAVYHDLDGGHRRLFRLVGVLHAPDFPAWVPAVLLDQPVDRIADQLEQLVDRRIITVAGQDDAGRRRYQMHDLFAVYARERAATEESLDHRHLGAGQLLHRWLTVVDHIEATRQRPRPVMPATRPTTPNPPAWFPTALATHPADPAESASQLACAATFTVVALFFEMRSHWDNWQMTRDVALVAAKRVGDGLHGSLSAGDLHVVLGSPPSWHRMTAELQTTRAIFADLREDRWQAATLTGIGNLYRSQGQLRTATATLLDALRRCRQLPDPRWEAATLFSLASLNVIKGQFAVALRRYRRCLTLTREHNDPRWAAHVHRAIGYANQQHGRPAAAIDALQHGLATFRRMNDQMWTAHTQLILGYAQTRLGQYTAAIRTLGICASVLADLGDPRNQAMALRALASAQRGAGKLRAAKGSVQTSLEIFYKIDDPIGVARVLLDLAATGANPPNDHRRTATTLLEQLGLRGWGGG